MRGFAVFLAGLILLNPAARAAALVRKIALPPQGQSETLHFGAATLMVANRGASVQVTAASPGAKPVNLVINPVLPQFAPTLTAAEMDPANATPEFLVQRYSGGAHCCAEVSFLDLVGGAWRVIAGGSWNGGDLVPADMDGDGEAEIAHGDDRFLYVFSCYACAAPPMRYFKLAHGALVDASASPVFTPLYEKDLPDLRVQCEKGDNGGCASYVAVAARLGRRAEAWAVMLKHYDRKTDWGLSTCGGYDAKGQCLAPARYKTYPQALDAFLRRMGEWRP